MKALAALVLLVGSAHASSPGAPNPAHWIDASAAVVVSVVPGSKPGVFKATAHIIDSRAGQLIYSPAAEGPAGDEIYLEGKAEGMGHSTRAGAMVKIAADGKSATYSVSVERDGAVLRTESGSLAVPPPGA